MKLRYSKFMIPKSLENSGGPIGQKPVSWKINTLSRICYLIGQWQASENFVRRKFCPLKLIQISCWNIFFLWIVWGKRNRGKNFVGQNCWNFHLVPKILSAEILSDKVIIYSLFLHTVDAESTNVEGLVTLFGDIHQSVATKSLQYLAKLSRHNYVTPTSYLELLGIFKKVLGIKKNEIVSAKHRTKTGLDKVYLNKSYLL